MNNSQLKTECCNYSASRPKASILSSDIVASQNSAFSGLTERVQTSQMFRGAVTSLGGAGAIFLGTGARLNRTQYGIQTTANSLHAGSLLWVVRPAFLRQLYHLCPSPPIKLEPPAGHEGAALPEP